MNLAKDSTFPFPKTQNDLPYFPQVHMQQKNGISSLISIQI